MALLDPADKQKSPKVTLLQTSFSHDLPLLSILLKIRSESNYFCCNSWLLHVPLHRCWYDLTNQLENLATYSFLAAAWYSAWHQLPDQCTLCNTQATVKNIIFTVVQMQKLILKGTLLLLEARIVLKVFVVDCRTQIIQKFWHWALAQKFGVATLIRSTMQHNPDLDMGHRRLSLRTLWVLII